MLKDNDEVRIEKLKIISKQKEDDVKMLEEAER
jgi:hypothetical protein